MGKDEVAAEKRSKMSIDKDKDNNKCFNEDKQIQTILIKKMRNRSYLQKNSISFKKLWIIIRKHAMLESHVIVWSKS